MNSQNTTRLTDYHLFSSSLDQLEIGPRTLINTLNPYSYVMAERDGLFKDALVESDILLPDGIGIVAANNMLNNTKIKKIAGADVHEFLLGKLNKEGGSCFYLGACANTLEKIKERLSAEYPAIRAGFYTPSFNLEFSPDEDADIISAINAFKPDVLFVGMTAPRQEKWAYIHRNLIEAKAIVSIGAVFDFFAGTVGRPGRWWIDMGLEWLGRLIKEPGRMWKRTVLYAPVFVYWMFKEKARQVADRANFLNGRHGGRNIIILGYNKLSERIAAYFESGGTGINIIGFCEDRNNIRELTHYPVLCGIDGAINVSLALHVQEIYSTISPEKDPRIYNLMRQADRECIRFKLVPDLLQFINHPVNVGYLHDLPVLSVHNDPLEKYANRRLKRMLDLAVSTLIIIFVLTWLVPLLGLLIKLESRGPVFFVQHRSGRNKKPFKCLKFRSMHVNKESDVLQATKNDGRFTKVGRFIRHTGLDEFPQFLNVFQGNMSLVGPRPHMLKHTVDFSNMAEKYPLRHFIKPGITGWAQIRSFRGEITKPEQVQERADHDVWYLENWSLWLDIRILFLTFWDKIKGEKNAF